MDFKLPSFKLSVYSFTLEQIEEILDSYMSELREPKAIFETFAADGTRAGARYGEIPEADREKAEDLQVLLSAFVSDFETYLESGQLKVAEPMNQAVGDEVRDNINDDGN